MSYRTTMHLTSNKRSMLCVLLGGTAIVAGCVTINIYFPAAAAEKAADRIIEEVWQLKGGVPASPAPGAKPVEK